MIAAQNRLAEFPQEPLAPFRRLVRDLAVGVAGLPGIDEQSTRGIREEGGGAIAQVIEGLPQGSPPGLAAALHVVHAATAVA